MEPPEACSVLTSVPCTLCVLGQITFPDRVCFLFYKTKSVVSLPILTPLHPKPRCCERLRGLAVHTQRNFKMPAVVSGWGQQEHVHVVCRFHLKNVGSQVPSTGEQQPQWCLQYTRLKLSFGSHVWSSGSIAGHSVTPGCWILKRLQKISVEGPFLLINQLPVPFHCLKMEIEAQRVERKQ